MRKDYPTDEVKRAVEQPYGIAVATVRRFDSGIENTNYDVKSSQGRFVLKIYEEISLESVEFEISFINHCRSKGLPVQSIICNCSGESISIFRGRPCVLFSYIEGEDLLHANMTEAIYLQIGKMLADFQKAAKDFKPNGSPWRVHYWDAKQFLINEPSLRFVNDAYKDEMLSVISEYRSIMPAFEECRELVIHNDFNLENVLIKDGIIAGIIDFGDVIKTVVVADIVVALTEISFALGGDVIKNSRVLCEEYTKHCPLNQYEKKVIIPLMKARFASFILILSQKMADGGGQDYMQYYIELGHNGLNLIKEHEKELKDLFS